jgi:hypothetical protein
MTVEPTLTRAEIVRKRMQIQEAVSILLHVPYPGNNIKAAIVSLQIEVARLLGGGY